VDPPEPLIQIAPGCELPLNIKPPWDFEYQMLHGFVLDELRGAITKAIGEEWEAEGEIIDAGACDGFIQIMRKVKP
jgi:hypothetical protein